MFRRVKAAVPAGLYYGLIFFLSAQPNVELPVSFPLIDKILHLFLYAGFGVCVTYSLIRLSRIKAWRQLLVLVLLGIVLGGLDEVHQMFVPGRSADVADAIADILGILAGWGMVRAWIRWPSGRRIFLGSASEPKDDQP